MSRQNFIPKRLDPSTLVSHWEDEQMALDYPALYQLLTYAKVEGRFRAGARLSLFCDDGHLKASLWDPDTSQVWFATLESFQGALEAIEKLLADGRGEWRVRKETNGRR